MDTSQVFALLLQELPAKADTEAYDFDPSEDLLSQLLQLNLEVAEREEKGMGVRGPGQLSAL